MERHEVDISQLSESQQLALQQFTSVTNQELEHAVPILQRSEWNVQVSGESHIRPFCSC
jgi:FAS-associated factor 2